VEILVLEVICEKLNAPSKHGFRHYLCLNFGLHFFSFGQTFDKHTLYLFSTNSDCLDETLELRLKLMDQHHPF
jgi:hypothetical protein